MKKDIILLAGRGWLPRAWARAAQDRGYRVVAVNVAGPEARKALEPLVEKVYDLHGADLQGLFHILTAEGINRLTAAGKFDKGLLFRSALKDLRLLRVLGQLKSRREEDIIGAVVKELAREGVEFIPQRQVLNELLPEPGVLTSCRPDEDLEKDLELAFSTACAISRLGIGQTVLVKEGMVVAVEAMEGTDKAVVRAGELAGTGLVMGKASWPGTVHELPAVGAGTLDLLEKTKARGLALQARRVMIVGGQEFLQRAQNLRITVVAMEVKD